MGWQAQVTIAEKINEAMSRVQAKLDEKIYFLCNFRTLAPKYFFLGAWVLGLHRFLSFSHNFRKDQVLSCSETRTQCFL